MVEILGVEILRVRKAIRRANRLAARRMTAGSGIVARCTCAAGAAQQDMSGIWSLGFVAEVEARQKPAGEAGGAGVVWW
ncbi:MAG TPA: hypothetical protein VN901_31445 [Candidatus Acidoferrales bacterium]|nr:hypothetical protein [Candidatus Acidoferrales bacterium]